MRRARRPRPAAGRRSAAWPPELRRLRRQRPARLGRDLLERPRRRAPRAAAATAPSTSGASHEQHALASSLRAIISTAISALITALPRSISTSTPSPDAARADRLHARASASVPIAPSSAIPPAALDRDVLAAHLARELDHALRQRALCETMTMPTTRAQRPVARCRISTGCTVCDAGRLLDVPAARLGVAHREVGRGLARSARTAPAPTSIAIGDFSS